MMHATRFSAKILRFPARLTCSNDLTLNRSSQIGQIGVNNSFHNAHQAHGNFVVLNSTLFGFLDKTSVLVDDTQGIVLATLGRFGILPITIRLDLSKMAGA
jgi:hypothetical protein